MALTLVTAAQMREIDRLTIEQYGVPGFTLMQRAAEGALRVFIERWGSPKGKRVLVVAGRGNNGGDGMVLASLLARQGAECQLLLLARPEELRGDAAAAWDQLRTSPVLVDTAVSGERVRAVAAGSEFVLDAMLGTGLNAPVRGHFERAIGAVNEAREAGKKVLALDIPSGLDADRGVPLGAAVHAHVTATFGLAKVGQVLYPGVSYVGDLRIVDIGLAAEAIAKVRPRSYMMEKTDMVGLLPRRAPDAHKGHFGHVLVVGGSRGRTGAAILAAEASVRAGAGLTTLAGPASLNPILAGHVPEVMTASLPEREGQFVFDPEALRVILQGKSVVVLGPGMGTDEQAQSLTRFVLTESELPVVCDADALTCVAREPQVLRACRCPPILTPHPGEMARLVGGSTQDVQADRPGTALRFAAEYRCVVVLKGARTVVASPDGELWVNPTGNPGMATGGMGDVLAGLIGAFRAQGLSAVNAARLGVFVHGAAADRLAESFAPVGYLASEVARQVPAVLGELSGSV